MLNTIVAELDRTALENQGVNLSVALTKDRHLAGRSARRGRDALQAASSLRARPRAPGGTTTPSGILPGAGQIIPLLLSPNLTYGLCGAGTRTFNGRDFSSFSSSTTSAKFSREPHLLANSGEKAKFLSGGEIPIVIAQALNSTIVFKTVRHLGRVHSDRHWPRRYRAAGETRGLRAGLHARRAAVRLYGSGLRDPAG